MAFYQRLKDLKEDADLTQKDVSEIIGVSINHYGKYERGETDIPLEKAVILAEYYNVSLDYLAGRTNVTSTANSKIKTSETIVSLFDKLNTVNRNRIEERMLEMLEHQNK